MTTTAPAPASVEVAAAAMSTARVGPLNRASAALVLAEIPTLPVFPADRHGEQWIRGAARILRWLGEHPGPGWQQRWTAAEGNRYEWIDPLCTREGLSPWAGKDELRRGLVGLLLCRAILPSYDFIRRYRPCALLSHTQQVVSPALFARLGREAQVMGLSGRQQGETLALIARVVLVTGKTVEQLAPDDLFEIRSYYLDARSHVPLGIYPAWDLLRTVGVLDIQVAMRTALRAGPRPTAELVDLYHVRSPVIRGVLIRYLDERRPGMDYGSFRALVTVLAGRFWADIEAHHPGIDTLALPFEVADAWKQRIMFTSRPSEQGRPRKRHLDLLTLVRAFYLDIQEWALDDAFWVPFAAPSPVRKGDTDGMAKLKRQVTAQIHQRIRERLPHLPVLVDTAEAHLDTQTTLLATANTTPVGEVFDHAGRSYRRTLRVSHTLTARHHGTVATLVTDLTTGGLVDLTRAEDEAFWTWAIVETLRHTGVRIEELLELTHLALSTYRLPDTGQIVPLLQIVPSKNDEERLLLVSPELASVLATIITRLRDAHGTIPLVARYDGAERVTGPPLPHLFQRKIGHRHEVINVNTVQKLLKNLMARTGLRDAAGAPLRYTAHDFRRIFVTEAVAAGLPVHIAARVLGHHQLTTTQSYLAVFQDDLIRAYQAFLTRRRAVRPVEEYREPADVEWDEFQQHFELRKVELGTCARPYGTGCKHEHACIRCPMLRVEPAQRRRLEQITINLTARIDEARTNGWLGEVEGLQHSLTAAKTKLAGIDRTARAARSTTADLGIPTISTHHGR